MTAAEWRACGAPEVMLRWLKTARRVPRRSTRKVQLFCQALAATATDLAGVHGAAEVIRAAGAAAERGGPAAAGRVERERLVRAVPAGWPHLFCRFLVGVGDPDAWWRQLPEDFAATLAGYARAYLGGPPAGAQADLVRDIFGDPFRPVAFDPSWQTPTAVAIAAGMYDSCDFKAMPILADALQDAGCADAEVLSHCREAGGHVRGCWVADGVLGKG